MYLIVYKTQNGTLETIKACMCVDPCWMVCYFRACFSSQAIRRCYFTEQRGAAAGGIHLDVDDEEAFDEMEQG